VTEPGEHGPFYLRVLHRTDRGLCSRARCAAEAMTARLRPRRLVLAAPVSFLPVNGSGGWEDVSVSWVKVVMP